jgi:DNA-binding MarR family transcriptional regulator
LYRFGVDVPGETETDREMAVRIGRAWKELRRGAAMSALRGHLFGAGDDALEPGQWDTLDLLVQREQWRMSELAEGLRVDPSTATRAVQRLLKSGLAERRSSDEDGRVVQVTATPLGHQRHAAIAEHRRDLMDAVLAEFDPTEREQLAALMERLLAAVDRFAGQVADPADSAVHAEAPG